MFSQKARLKIIMEAVQRRYAEIPADISRRLQEVQMSLQREEDKVTQNRIESSKISNQNLFYFAKCSRACVCVCVCVCILQFMEKSYPVQKLNHQVVELGSGLEKVKVLLEQKSLTVDKAQNLIKVCVGLCSHACLCVHVT